MTVTEILLQLKALGNEKVRTLNIRNGANDNQFGVKLGDIRTLAGKIKSNHTLGLDLWDTGNLDARLLAALIIKPQELSPAEVDRLVRSAGVAQLADWLAAYVIKEYPRKEELRLMWLASDDRWALRAGWGLTAGRVVRNPEGIDIPGLLDRIELEMPVAYPEVQWTINTTLAQIGIHHPLYRERALAIGEELGIYRDYPVSKGCTSPFAPIWISEMVRRQK